MRACACRCHDSRALLLAPEKRPNKQESFSAATAVAATKMSSRRSALPMICLARKIRRMARRRQEQRPQRGINWRSPQWSRGVPMLQCWHLYYSVIFSRGQRGLQRTAETCGGGGSSGIDDKTRHVGLHVHSFTSEGFVILVLTRINTSSEIRSFGYPPRFRIILAHVVLARGGNL